MNYKKFKINNTHKTKMWSELIKKSFDFKNGQGQIQINLKHLFPKKNCEDIFKKF